MDVLPRFILIEDALGRKYPFPSKYDYGTLEVIIKHKFREGTRSPDVRDGRFEFCNRSRRSKVITPQSRSVPESAILMVILIRTLKQRGGPCPMPNCGSQDAVPSLGGGVTW